MPLKPELSCLIEDKNQKSESNPETEAGGRSARPPARPSGRAGSLRRRDALRHLCEEALFAGAEEIGDAARAQRRVFGIAADARHIVPAAFAFLFGRRLDGNRRLSAVSCLREFHFTHDHHKAKFVAE